MSPGKPQRSAGELSLAPLSCRQLPGSAEHFPALPVLSPCHIQARPQVWSKAGNLAPRHGAAKSPACSSVSGLASELLWGVQICSQSVCFAAMTPRHTGNRDSDQEGAIVRGTFLTVALLCFIPSIHRAQSSRVPQPELHISTDKPGVCSFFYSICPSLCPDVAF